MNLAGLACNQSNEEIDKGVMANESTNRAEGSALQAARFLVGDKPHCVWDWDLKKRNLDFISAFDPEYFQFMAETIAQRWQGEGDHRAAMSIRMLYGHALETFFALVGATVQAPHCIPGWLQKYHQKDLENIAQRMNQGHGLATLLSLKPLNWQNFSSALIHRVIFDSEEERQRVADGFQKAWTRFANDMGRQELYREYNYIKHGFRARPGGFTMAVGQEKAYGVPPSPSEMVSLGGSKYGASFFVPEPLGNSKNHFRLRSVSRNWIPENYFNRVCLLSMSMTNIISFLKEGLDDKIDPKTLKFAWPAETDGFDKPWAGNIGVTDCSFDSPVESGDIKIFTDEEIRADYQNK